jgi:hypothetical protein
MSIRSLLTNIFIAGSVFLSTTAMASDATREAAKFVVERADEIDTAIRAGQLAGKQHVLSAQRPDWPYREPMRIASGGFVVTIGGPFNRIFEAALEAAQQYRDYTRSDIHFDQAKQAISVLAMSEPDGFGSDIKAVVIKAYHGDSAEPFDVIRPSEECTFVDDVRIGRAAFCDFPLDAFRRLPQSFAGSSYEIVVVHDEGVEWTKRLTAIELVDVR